jgi:hypothetical protein
VSQAILTLLREHAAFKPKPPEYELAIAHVPLDQVGLENPIDDRVPKRCAPMTRTSRSCSRPQAAARRACSAPPQCMPRSVNLSHGSCRCESRSAITRHHLTRCSYGPSPPSSPTNWHRCSKSDRVNALERALATTITRSRQGTRISVALNAVAPHSPIGASLGVQLAGDLTTLTSQGGWQGGPHAGLLALRDIADARNARLVVIFDDADTWSEGDEEIAPRARDFFVALQALIDCPEVTMFVAVQDHWGTAGTRLGPNTEASRARYRELERRAGRRLAVPLPKTRSQARALMSAILERRIAITLPEQEPPTPAGAPTCSPTAS